MKLVDTCLYIQAHAFGNARAAMKLAERHESQVSFALKRVDNRMSRLRTGIARQDARVNLTAAKVAYARKCFKYEINYVTGRASNVQAGYAFRHVVRESLATGAARRLHDGHIRTYEREVQRREGKLAKRGNRLQAMQAKHDHYRDIRTFTFGWYALGKAPKPVSGGGRGA